MPISPLAPAKHGRELPEAAPAATQTTASRKTRRASAQGPITSDETVELRAESGASGGGADLGRHHRGTAVPASLRSGTHHAGEKHDQRDTSQ